MDVTNLSLIAAAATTSSELTPTPLGEVLLSDAFLGKLAKPELSGIITIPGLVTTSMRRVACMAATSESHNERREYRLALDGMAAKHMEQLFKDKRPAGRHIDDLLEVKKMRT